jgi:hypothetical protein
MTEPALLERIQRIVLFSAVGFAPQHAAEDVVFADLRGLIDGALSAQAGWLPTTQDAPLPEFDDLASVVRSEGAELQARQAALAAVAAALRVSRGARSEALVIGPDDLNPAARGAFVFTCRRTAMEDAVGRPGFWSRVLGWYERGHWPAAFLPGPPIRLVVV